jgi:hypothetical protein
VASVLSRIPSSWPRLLALSITWMMRESRFESATQKLTPRLQASTMGSASLQSGPNHEVPYHSTFSSELLDSKRGSTRYLHHQSSTGSMLRPCLSHGSCPEESISPLDEDEYDVRMEDGSTGESFQCYKDQTWEEYRVITTYLWSHWLAANTSNSGESGFSICTCVLHMRPALPYGHGRSFYLVALKCLSWYLSPPQFTGKPTIDVHIYSQPMDDKGGSLGARSLRLTTATELFRNKRGWPIQVSQPQNIRVG